MSIEGFVVVLTNVAHFLTNLPGDYDPSQILDPDNNSMFLFPVNNSENHEQADDRTHWSLVVIRIDRVKNEYIFMHHDSNENINRVAS